MEFPARCRDAKTKKMKTKKVWVTVKSLGDIEEIEMFDSYDEMYGLYDYAEETLISKRTYDKMVTGNYFLKRVGKTFKAFSC